MPLPRVGKTLKGDKPQGRSIGGPSRDGATMPLDVGSL